MVTMMETCSKHPTYKAIGKPRSMCAACWAIWDAKEAERKRIEAEENEVSTMCYHPATDEGLRELAWNIATHRVFTNRHCYNSDEMLMVFPILQMMKLCDRKWIAANPPGLVWEFNAKACPAGVNGLPVFLSARFLSTEDLPKMEAYLKEAQETQQRFMKTGLTGGIPVDDCELEPIPGTGPCGDFYES